MSTVREKFHELGNWHNKISLAAITARESLRETKKLSPSELNSAVEKALKLLTKIGDYVQGADETVGTIKPFVYQKIGADVTLRSDDDPQGGPAQ